MEYKMSNEVINFLKNTTWETASNITQLFSNNEVSIYEYDSRINEPIYVAVTDENNIIWADYNYSKVVDYLMDNTNYIKKEKKKKEK